MILVYNTEDSPLRTGYEPKDGEHLWTFTIPLDNGDTLRITGGSKTRQALIHVLNQEEIDNTLEEVIQDGTSQNDNQAPAR